MKKLRTLTLALVLVSSLILAACGSQPAASTVNNAEGQTASAKETTSSQQQSTSAAPEQTSAPAGKNETTAASGQTSASAGETTGAASSEEPTAEHKAVPIWKPWPEAAPGWTAGASAGAYRNLIFSPGSKA